MKINAHNTEKVQAALDDVQAAFRAGRLNTANIAQAALTAERALTARSIPKNKRAGALYRVYAREGAGTYAILTRGATAATPWFLTEVGRVTGVHGWSEVYTGIDRDELALYDTLGITPEDFAPTLSIGTADIAADGVSVQVRRGIGGDAYVALLTGTDDTYGLEREFIPANRGLSRSGKTGSVEWGALADGIYNIGGFCTTHGSGAHALHAFFIVRGGLVASLGERRAAVLKAVA